MKLSFKIFIEYGPTQNMEKIKVQKEIEKIMIIYELEISIIRGVFDTITNASENGVELINSLKQQYIFINGLIDIVTSRDSCTWDNKRKGFNFIAEKLDRLLLNGDMVEIPFTLESKVKPVSNFDHYAVELCIIKDKKPNNCPFKFAQIWFKDEGFINMVEKKMA